MAKISPLVLGREQVRRRAPDWLTPLLRLIPVRRRMGGIAVTECGRLVYDEDWLAEQGEEDCRYLGGLLAHETLHPMLDFWGRMRGRNPRIWNIAQDLYINDVLCSSGWHLPPEGMFPEKFGFPSGLSAEEYYERLRELAEALEERPEGGGGGENEGRDGSGDSSESGQGDGQGGSEAGDEAGQSGSETGDEAGQSGSEGGSEAGSEGGDEGGQRGSEAGDEGGQGGQGGQGGSEGGNEAGNGAGKAGNGGGDEAGKAGNGGGDEAGKAGNGGGNSAGGGTPEIDPDALEVLRQALRAIERMQRICCEVDALDADEDGEIPRRSSAEMRALAQEIADAVRKTRGNLPQSLLRIAEEVAGPPAVPWYEILRSVVGRTVEAYGGPTPTYARLSRRQGLFGIAPGRPLLPLSLLEEPVVWIAIDTSGSMTRRELGLALREVAGACEALTERLYVVAADADVHRPVPVRDVEEARECLIGGGGTDFRPVFELADRYHEERRAEAPNVLVYVTDGHGPAPGAAPTGYETIWVTTDRAPASWGQIVEVRR